MSINPWARRQARRAAVQALYQWQMTQTPVADIITDRTLDGSLKKADTTFFVELLRGSVGAVEEQAADATHNKADAPFAPHLDREPKALDKVELAILRLGCFELCERIDVPYRVVIDEYVELAKVFGAEESHKYVNAVLDKVAADTRTVEVAAQS